ncbi:nitrate reductase cytochrome c-type subunit [Thiohalocapsa marina]|uniref:Periplasmic nitrate reductase, electron transfer subunit n=1 Tax=Thiohalocapsa marina TaxID=424902 RepID=A0A5M8FRP9_9GAMM|nr:nitrate reductase cytochrome c-type subunit [Thiohalocapsa marina]KAA6186301.1 nitrate reductase cytochrome c-type subunit [Thiohalocapsa marina]
MKKPILTLLVGAAALITANLGPALGQALAQSSSLSSTQPANASVGVASLRGHAVTDASDETLNKPTLAVPGGFQVSWEEQPPMIPHPIDKYSINLRQNGCLKCHSPATYEAAKAPAVASSHFLDRDGNRTNGIAPRRYFCTQCHAPQAGAMPLVENVFQGR